MFAYIKMLVLCLLIASFLHFPYGEENASSETQGQIVGTRKSLNGRKNMARRKVKNGEKSPWGQCLTRPVPNGRRRSAFWLGRKTQKFSGTNQKPERWRPFGTSLVRHCPQGLFSPFFTFLRAIFFRPFRLFLVPTICPWVSEDEENEDSPKTEAQVSFEINRPTRSPCIVGARWRVRRCRTGK